MGMVRFLTFIAATAGVEAVFLQKKQSTFEAVFLEKKRSKLDQRLDVVRAEYQSVLMAHKVKHLFDYGFDFLPNSVFKKMFDQEVGSDTALHAAWRQRIKPHLVETFGPKTSPLGWVAKREKFTVGNLFKPHNDDVNKRNAVKKNALAALDTLLQPKGADYEFDSIERTFVVLNMVYLILTCGEESVDMVEPARGPDESESDDTAAKNKFKKIALIGEAGKAEENIKGIVADAVKPGSEPHAIGGLRQRAYDTSEPQDHAPSYNTWAQIQFPVMLLLVNCAFGNTSPWNGDPNVLVMHENRNALWGGQLQPGTPGATSDAPGSGFNWAGNIVMILADIHRGTMRGVTGELGENEKPQRFAREIIKAVLHRSSSKTEQKLKSMPTLVSLENLRMLIHIAYFAPELGARFTSGNVADLAHNLEADGTLEKNTIKNIRKTLKV